MTTSCVHTDRSAPPPDERLTAAGWGRRLRVAAGCVLLAVGAALVALSCCHQRPPTPVHPVPPGPGAITMPAYVDVAVPHRSPEFVVDSDGPGTWHDATGRLLFPAGEGPWKVASTYSRLTINAQYSHEGLLEFRPAPGAFWSTSGRTYRGALRVRPLPDGKLVVRNRLDPEDYLRSVVGREVYPSWHEHALLAQAVAARTYMLYALSGRSYLSSADMAYRGVGEEHPRTTEAVRGTRGIILTHAGSILPAYFQSTCGGHTMAVEKFTDRVRPMKPLAGRPCDWCSASRTYRWRVRLSAADIHGALTAAGLAAVDGVDALTPEGRPPDGYARWIVINGEARVDAYAFRRAIGSSRLKSTNFDVTKSGRDFIFDGRGHGHGVGLCQWGAQGMARAGRNWQEILEFYYPGAVLQRAKPSDAGGGDPSAGEP